MQLALFMLQVLFFVLFVLDAYIILFDLCFFSFAL